MENYHFNKITDSLTNSISTCSPLQKELIEQMNHICPLSGIQLSQDQLLIDSPLKLKLIKTTMFHCRSSMQESFEGSDNAHKILITNQVTDQKNIELENIDQLIQVKLHLQKNRTQANQNIKRAMKRSQTSIKNQLGQFLKPPGNKLFIKKTNSTIVNNFEQLRQQKSFFTFKIRENEKSYLRTIQVKYFGTNQAKVLFIEREMSAIEFIVLALKEYAEEKKFDQNLYQFKNCTLAYQLVTEEDEMEIDEEKFRRPLQRTKSFKSQEDEYRKSKRVSYDERAITSQLDFSLEDLEEKTITIDYPAQLSCKQVDLIVNTNCQQTFNIDLLMIKRTQDLFPDFIIILIEDIQEKGQFLIKCHPNDMVVTLLEKFSTISYQRSIQNCYLRLKYPCIHYGIEPLNPSTPINQLPIHWLVIEQKYTYELLPKSTNDLSNKLSIQRPQNILDDKFLDNIIDTKEGANLEIKVWLSSIYSYQQFDLVMIKNFRQFHITFGIDYFDINIQSEDQQINNQISFFQQITNFLASLASIKQKTQYTISMKQLINASLDERQTKFFILFRNSLGKEKRLSFLQVPNNDKTKMILNKKQFAEAFQKLKRLLIIRKHNNTQTQNK